MWSWFWIQGASEARLPRHGRVFTLLCVMAALIGCAKKNTYVEPPPPEVTVTHATQRDVTEYLEAPATADPTVVVEIRARVRGFLKERLVKEGATVQEGQPLMVIDEEPFQVQLDQAKAHVVEMQTALQKTKQSQAREMMRAQLALDQSQLGVAITEEQRMAPLTTTRAISQEEYDRAVADRKKNEAQVAATKANLTQVDADFETNIAAAQAQVAVAQNAVRNAEIELSYCRITSPTAGRIGRIHYDVGNLVGDGQASLLTTVVKYDPIYVYATVSGDDFLNFRKTAGALSKTGTETEVPIELALGSGSDYQHRGHIDYHDPTVDKGTGTIQLRGIFPNPNGEILPGMFGRVRIPIAKRTNALLVPEQCLGIDQSGQYLLVVGPDDKVNYRQVHIGRVDQGMRVVEGKLGLEDRIILEGLLRARPGMKVVAHAETPPEAPAKVASDTADSANPRTRKAMQ
jgi:RND family efflux transporter MFP subunit